MNKPKLIEFMHGLQKIIKSKEYEIAEAKEQCKRKDAKIAELESYIKEWRLRNENRT